MSWKSILLLSLCLGLPVAGQTPPEPPTPTADSANANLFYGAVPPAGDHASVLLFVPGLFAKAQSWWGPDNDMYAYAYQAGYRTAFLSFNLANLPTVTGIYTNAKVLKQLVPVILGHYGVSQVYFVTHSLGGLDVQALLADPKFLRVAQAVFALSTPNQGDKLANFVFSAVGRSTGKTLGLLIPAVADLRTKVVLPLRAKWDPIFAAAGIPFYTLSGNTYIGDVLTEITGPILQGLTGGLFAPPNDGLVTHPESLLPTSYAVEMGVVHGDHFAVDQGHNAFSFMSQFLR